MVRLTSRRRGAIAVMAAIMIAILLGFAAFALDYGNALLVRTQLQCAADAAARAGASALSAGPDAARNAAESCGEANLTCGNAVQIVPAEDIQLGTWDEGTSAFTVLTGANQANAKAVRVTCRVSQARGNALPSPFGRILGKDFFEIAASAVASASGGTHPFIGLDGVTISGGSYTDSYNSSAGPYSGATAGSEGNVESNDAVSLSGGSEIHGGVLLGPSGTVNEPGAVTGSVQLQGSPITLDPINFHDSPTHNDNWRIGLSQNGMTVVDSAGAFNVSGGDQVTLPPGKFYFSTMTASGGSIVMCSGPTTIYCTGDVNFSGGSLVNPTQIPADLQIFCDGSKAVFSGSTQFYGIVYAPNADVTRSGGSSDCFGALMGKTLTLSGGGGCHGDQAGGWKVKLVQ